MLVNRYPFPDTIVPMILVTMSEKSSTRIVQTHLSRLVNGKLPSLKMAVCQNLVPLVNIKIAGKWMFIPLKMVLIGIDPYPNR